ncbi:unnamed protein product, partial [marine sediment metagenome]
FPAYCAYNCKYKDKEQREYRGLDWYLHNTSIFNST